MLQTRNGKRTAMAALKFSMDMCKEKLIDWKTAVMRNPADQLDQLLAPVFDVAEAKKADGRLRRACPPAPAPRPARFISMPIAPSPRPNGRSRSCWSASRRRPKISAA